MKHLCRAICTAITATAFVTRWFRAALSTDESDRLAGMTDVERDLDRRASL